MSNGTEGILYKEKVVYKALEELDEILYKKGIKPFELNVIGGFAMTVEQIRMSDYTDIDYIGKDLPDEIKEIINEIGIRYGLGRGWINNDCLMSGNTLEDLEGSTGKLKFNHAFDLRVITVNTLDKRCILRMKVIAVDTSYSATEFGGDFTRVKDLPDIKILLDKCGMSYNDLVIDNFDYVLCPEIFYIIRYYLNGGEISKLNIKEERDRIIRTKGKEI